MISFSSTQNNHIIQFEFVQNEKTKGKMSSGWFRKEKKKEVRILCCSILLPKTFFVRLRAVRGCRFNLVHILCSLIKTLRSSFHRIEKSPYSWKKDVKKHPDWMECKFLLFVCFHFSCFFFGWRRVTSSCAHFIRWHQNLNWIWPTLNTLYSLLCTLYSVLCRMLSDSVSELQMEKSFGRIIAADEMV